LAASGAPVGVSAQTVASAAATAASHAVVASVVRPDNGRVPLASVAAPAVPATPVPPPVQVATKPAPVKMDAPAKAAPSAPAVAATDSGRAQALLDGKTGSDKPAANDAGRFVVQFGAFSDAGRAHEARIKVEHAGFKTYAQIAQGPDGNKRYRVRVGPFVHRAEAEKAAEKIKKLDLPASILAL